MVTGKEKMKSGDRTKEKIAAAFKKLVTQKPFDKITITDITDACGLNRLTFYYHFQDKYDLMNWIFYREVVSSIEGEVDAGNWLDKLYRCLKAISDDKKFYISAINYDRVEIRNFISDVTANIMEAVIYEYVKDRDVDKEDIAFVAKFFSHGLTGIVYEWIAGGMATDPEDIVNRTFRVLESCKVILFENLTRLT